MMDMKLIILEYNKKSPQLRGLFCLNTTYSNTSYVSSTIHKIDHLLNHL